METHTIFAVITLFILLGVLILTQSQRRCFDVYVVRLKSVELETGSGGSGLHELIETDPIIPSVDGSGDGEGRLTLNVTTNSTLSTNMFYNATLITTMDMMEAGSIQLCECAHVYLGTIGITDLFHVKSVCQEFGLLNNALCCNYYVCKRTLNAVVCSKTCYTTQFRISSQSHEHACPLAWICKPTNIS